MEEAMNAAAKIGDDALQRGPSGTVVPESFTHGTSAQRQRWFTRAAKGSLSSLRYLRGAQRCERLLVLQRFAASGKS
jgi:predicted metalloprotease